MNTNARIFALDRKFWTGLLVISGLYYFLGFLSCVGIMVADTGAVQLFSKWGLWIRILTTGFVVLGISASLASLLWKARIRRPATILAASMIIASFAFDLHVNGIEVGNVLEAIIPLVAIVMFYSPAETNEKSPYPV